jgi:hypothetical protein
MQGFDENSKKSGRICFVELSSMQGQGQGQGKGKGQGKGQLAVGMAG